MPLSDGRNLFASGSRRPVRWCQPGRQTGEQDIESAVELCGAVVVSQSRCQRAHVRELGHRKPVQTQPQDIVGLLGPLDDFLNLGEYVAMQVPEEHTGRPTR